MRLPEEKPVHAKPFFCPRKFTGRIGLSVNTCEVARAAELPFRGVQTQNVTAEICVTLYQVPEDTHLLEVVARSEVPDHSSHQMVHYDGN